MADLFLEEPDFELRLQPVEAEVRFLSAREIDSSLPSLSQGSRFGDYVDESLLPTTVPDPIKLRGVGGTTL